MFGGLLAFFHHLAAVSGVKTVRSSWVHWLWVCTSHLTGQGFSSQENRSCSRFPDTHKPLSSVSCQHWRGAAAQSIGNTLAHARTHTHTINKAKQMNVYKWVPKQVIASLRLSSMNLSLFLFLDWCNPTERLLNKLGGRKQTLWVSNETDFSDWLCLIFRQKIVLWWGRSDSSK